MDEPILTAQTFLDRHKDSEFRHKEELMAGIRSGECTLDQINRARVWQVPCRVLLRTYRVRERSLARYSGEHAMTLHDDVAELCRGLKESPPEQNVGYWRFLSTQPCSFTVFENAATQQVLGCMRMVSKLDVTPDEWQKLWNG